MHPFAQAAFDAHNAVGCVTNSAHKAMPADAASYGLNYLRHLANELRQVTEHLSRSARTRWDDESTSDEVREVVTTLVGALGDGRFHAIALGKALDRAGQHFYEIDRLDNPTRRRTGARR